MSNSPSSRSETNVIDKDNKEQQDSSPGRCYNNSEHHRSNDMKRDCTESLYSNGCNDFEQDLWLSFQNTASAIAQLYREKAQGHDRDEMWISFQNAAEIATIMYRDSIDGCKVVSDLAYQCGYQRRNKEILAWAKKRKRNIRREDLLTFLYGHTSPTVKPSSKSQDSISRDKLQTFHEAVSLNSLDGAMAGINFDSDTGSSPLHQSSPRDHHDETTDHTVFRNDEIRCRGDSASGSSSTANRKRLTAVHLNSPSPKRRK